jgi:hypothetical protein
MIWRGLAFDFFLCRGQIGIGVWFEGIIILSRRGLEIWQHIDHTRLMDDEMTWGWIGWFSGDG